MGLSSTTQEERGYLFLFLITTLGAAIRKWFTESSAISNSILLIEMLMPFIWMFFRSNNSNTPFKYSQLLVFYFLYLAFHIINPLQHTFFHGALGFIIYGSFWLGIFYYMSNRHLFNPTKFIKIILIICALEMVLAFIQYQLPREHFLNKYAREIEAGVAMVEDRVRVSGTFSYLSGFTAFMVFYPFLIWAMFKLNYSSWFTAVAIIFGSFAVFMTGSRSCFVLFFAFLSIILYQTFTFKTFTNYIVKLLIPLAIGVAILSITNPKAFYNQIDSAFGNFFKRVERGTESGEQSQRVNWDVQMFKNNHFKHPIMGIGLGATYQGATITFGQSELVSEFGYVENEPVKIVLEGGIIMAILKLCLATLLIRNLSFKGPIRYLIWFTIVYAMPITFNVHNAAFFLMGLILIDNIFWRQQQEQLAVKTSE